MRLPRETIKDQAMFDTYRKTGPQRGYAGLRASCWRFASLLNCRMGRRVLDHVGNYGRPKRNLLSLKRAKRGDRGRLPLSMIGELSRLDSRRRSSIIFSRKATKRWS